MNEKKTLFKVSNWQSADSGEPPTFDGDTPDRYYGYFLNAFGEQLIFEYNRTTREGNLWHGDAGWSQSHSVTDGTAPGLVLSDGEKLWLRACWLEAAPNLPND
ncbi:hypothetical protein ACFLYO_01615 [Chloroflexota bacterium]